MCIDRGWECSRIGECGIVKADGEIVDACVGFFQMKIAALVAVEVCLDIELIVPDGLVASDHPEKQACSGRSCAEVAHGCRIRIHRYEHGSKAGAGHGAVPVKISAHAYRSADAHGE